MSGRRETDLYEPIKRFWLDRGYEVRSEVRHCDLVAMRPGDREPVIVELKRSFNLSLVLQGLDRQRQSSRVYLAVEKPRKAKRSVRWSQLRELCLRLGLGLFAVTFYKTKPPFVELLCDPAGGPAPSHRATGRLVGEFRERSGDYNVGGSTRRRIVTAYREQALRCAWLLGRDGPASPRAIRERLGIGKAPDILQDNHYGWFERVTRGLYRLTPVGEDALREYSDIVATFGDSAACPPPPRYT